MINPFAESFMIAARVRGAAYWERPGFANKRDSGDTPRLTTRRRSAGKGLLGLFRR